MASSALRQAWVEVSEGDVGSKAYTEAKKLVPRPERPHRRGWWGSERALKLGIGREGDTWSELRTKGSGVACRRTAIWVTLLLNELGCNDVGIPTHKNWIWIDVELGYLDQRPNVQCVFDWGDNCDFSAEALPNWFIEHSDLDGFGSEFNQS